MSDQDKQSDAGKISHSDVSYEDIMSKDILELLDLAEMPKEEKEKLKTVMEETIKNRIIARVVDSMSEEELEEWQKLESKDDKIDFLRNHKLSLEKIALEEALMYKYELTALVKQMKNKAV